MKKSASCNIAILFVILTLLITGCGENTKAAFDHSPADPPPYHVSDVREPFEDEWTMMVYMNSDNHNFELALEDINKMEMAKMGDAPVNVIVLIDGPQKKKAASHFSETRLYKVTTDPLNESPVIASERLFSNELKLKRGLETEMNMGDPSTLSKFVEFCKTTYPAEKYMLQFWDRRNSVPAKNNSQIKLSEMLKENTVSELSIALPDIEDYYGFKSAICFDETNGDYLLLSELRMALDGKPLDIITMGNRFSGSLENAYELKDLADVLIACPGNSAHVGLEYTPWLTRFSESDLTIESLYTTLIDSSDTFQYDTKGISLGVYDLSKIDPLYTAFESFILKMATDLQNAEMILENLMDKGALNTSLSHLGHIYIDIGNMAATLKYEGAWDVQKALDEVIIARFSLKEEDKYLKSPNQSGMLVYLFTLAESYPDSKEFHLRTSLDYMRGGFSDFTSASYWPQLLYNLLVNL